jgi:universal stress protein A
MKTTGARVRRRSKAASGGRKTTREAKVIELVPALLNIRSILVPIDFSETSKKAMQYAMRMAEQFNAKITVLSVVEPISSPDLAYYPLMMEADQVKQSVQAKLDSFCSQMRLPQRLLQKTIVRQGVPYAEITDAARTLKVDLIVITTHGYTGLKHVFLGSTAERVVRHAPCPVLTVREKEHEFI